MHRRIFSGARTDARVSVSRAGSAGISERGVRAYRRGASWREDEDEGRGGSHALREGRSSPGQG